MHVKFAYSGHLFCPVLILVSGEFEKTPCVAVRIPNASIKTLASVGYMRRESERP